MWSRAITLPSAVVAMFAAIALAAPKISAAEENAPLKAFFGSYVGTAQIDDEEYPRDIIVAINPAHKGFSIYTSTGIRKGPDRAVPGVKWRAETQTFVQSGLPHLYEPMLRESMFVRRRTPDLLAGDTLAWASIRGRSLGVYAIDVLADGHYELRVYERTLTELGMDLKFTRFSDGVVVRRLTGTLARTAPDTP